MHNDSRTRLSQKKLDRRAINQVIIILFLLSLLLMLPACSLQNNSTAVDDAAPTPDNDSAVEEDTPLPDTAFTAENCTPENFVDIQPGKMNEECPQLDSKLYQLFSMENPIPTAEQLGFRVKDGKVQVVLTLVDENTEIPEGFDLDVGTRVGNQVQVFVTFEVLCDLANTDEVVAVRQPMEPILE